MFIEGHPLHLSFACCDAVMLMLTTTVYEIIYFLSDFQSLFFKCHEGNPEKTDNALSLYHEHVQEPVLDCHIPYLNAHLVTSCCTAHMSPLSYEPHSLKPYSKSQS